MDDSSGILQKKPRSPAWSKDELILALDLYFRGAGSLKYKEDPDIQDLSTFLVKMALPSVVEKYENYRSYSSVSMKLDNFKRLDPKCAREGRKGLKNGGRTEEQVWNDYAGAPEKLVATVSAIRTFVEHGQWCEVTRKVMLAEDEPEIEEAEEGTILTRFHRVRERDRNLVKVKKQQVISKRGKLECEACGFDFFSRYGYVGKEIIDVHHTKPLHTLKPGEKTHINDLALLCSNCHRVVHSSKQWLTIEQLKALLLRVVS